MNGKAFFFFGISEREGDRDSHLYVVGGLSYMTNPGVGRQSDEYVVFGEFIRFSEVRYTHPDVLARIT